MKSFVRAMSVSCVAVLLAAAPSAHASTVISGEVWEGGTTGSVPSYSSLSSTAPTATFTLSGQPNLINFTSNGSTDYTIGSFLGTSGDTVTNWSSNVSGDSLDNTVFRFTGASYLAGGSVISLTHDDGLNLYLDGSSTCSICSGAPTSSITSSYTIPTSGTYTYVLDYAEVSGPPAVLTDVNGSLSAATPEPSSIALLGSGLLAGAGFIRRRFQA
jgi:hypothetical protein